MTEAFRTFALDTPFQARTLYSRISKLKAEHVAMIGDGYCKDWPDYQKRRGVIEGLMLALSLCEDMMKEEDR